MRLVFLVSGLALTAIGIVGLFVPLMPSTIFIILAACCFSKSSPRAERWLLNHRRFGPPLRCWRETGSISRLNKALAIAFLWLGICAALLLAYPIWSKLVIASAGVAITAYLLSRPTIARPASVSPDEHRDSDLPAIRQEVASCAAPTSPE